MTSNVTLSSGQAESPIMHLSVCGFSEGESDVVTDLLVTPSDNAPVCHVVTGPEGKKRQSIILCIGHISL